MLILNEAFVDDLLPHLASRLGAREPTWKVLFVSSYILCTSYMHGTKYPALTPAGFALSGPCEWTATAEGG